MSLIELFRLTPAQPNCTIENDQVVATAFINFWNISVLAWGGAGGTTPTLETQQKEGWIYMSGGAAAPDTEDADGIIRNRERSQVIEIGMQFVNAPASGKLLVRSEFHALGDNAVIHVAVNRTVVRTERLGAGDSSVAILLDIPKDKAWTYLDLKHVQTADGKASAFTFKSVAGYLA